jgi:hypothetical protein
MDRGGFGLLDGFLYIYGGLRGANGLRIKYWNMKKVLSYFPEGVFVGGALLSCVMGSSTVYLEMIGIALIVTLLLWRNRVYAVALSAVIGLIGLYMILALWSELGEFPARTAEYWEMFLVGHLLLCGVVVCAGFMQGKYVRKI